MAVGYWKTPTEAAYIAPADTSQNQHIEGLPFGTRGGMLVRHNFPSDGEYKFSIQNFGIWEDIFPARNWNSSLTARECICPITSAWG